MKIFPLRQCIAVLVTVLAPSFATYAQDGKAEALATESQLLLDRWDGESEILDAADKLLQEALRIDPASTHALAEQARRVLLAGTEEGQVRPSALKTAEGLLNRTLLSDKPPHPRAMALRGHLYNLTGRPGQVFKALRPAEALLPNDPWVKLYWAEYYGLMGDKASENRYLEQAIEMGLTNKRELREALGKLLPAYNMSHMREKAFAAHARQVALDPADPYVRGNFARDAMAYFVDFDAGERIAREALALADYPHARQTLSLALYGRWAQAAEQGKGPAVLEKLFREAMANDPDGRGLPECMASYPPLQFVFVRLEAKRIRREQMHRC